MEKDKKKQKDKDQTRRAKITKWFKLDRSADIYPMSATRTVQSNFRISAELVDPIDMEVLEVAVDKALNRYPSFRVHLRRGFFRYILEKNSAKPKVFKSNGIAFEPIDFLRNNRFLFRTKVYNKTIELDFFHGLSDAGGAIELLKTIIYTYYLELGVDMGKVENIRLADDEADPVEWADDVLKYYKKFKLSDDVIKVMIGKNCYGIKGKKLVGPGFAITNATMKSNDLLTLARTHQLSITELVAGMLMYCVNNTYKNAKGKDLVAMIPINLRRVFPSETLHNFTTLIRCPINPKEIENNYVAYAKAIQETLRREIKEKDFLQAKLSLSALLSKNSIAKMIPVSIKTLFVKLPKLLSVGTKQTMIVSNVGVVKAPDKLTEKIENITANLNVSNKIPINCGISTIGDKLAINFTRKLVDPKLELAFFTLLKDEGVDFAVFANDRIEHIQKKSHLKSKRKKK